LEAPPRPPRIDPEALFEEARRHRRRRRLRLTPAVLALVAGGVGAYVAVAGGGSATGGGGGSRVAATPRYRAVVLRAEGDDAHLEALRQAREEAVEGSDRLAAFARRLR
jgi:hypothetical protein